MIETPSDLPGSGQVIESVVARVMGSGECIFGEVWKNDAQLRAFVAKRAEHFACQLRVVAEKRELKPRHLRKAVFHALGSFDARFCSLIIAWPAWKGPISQQHAIALGEKLNLRKPSGEPVHTKLIEKAEGGTRRIWCFGPKTRAMQSLAMHVLMAVWGPAKFDFARKGRGRDAAMRKIMEITAKNGGPRWFLTADITDCFGSFNRTKLFDLIPLPKSVICNSIIVMDWVKITHDKDDVVDTSEIAVLSGLPQGSLASLYIATKLIEPVLEEVPDDLVVSHVDDILVGSRTEKEAKANELLLGDLLAGHPAGPLLMKSNVADLGHPIDFLSYRLRRRWLRYGGGVRLTPSAKAYARFELRAFKRLVDLPLEARESAALEYMKNWSASHALWERSPAGDDLVWITMLAHVMPAVTSHLKKSQHHNI